MNKYDFKLENGDNNSGTVYLPDFFDRKVPVVIYCHGWGGNRALNPSTQSLCSALLDSSAAMVTFDFWGCGDTGGSYNQMSYGRWTSNLKDVFEWVSQQEWADRQKIGCFSISSGTIAALRLAENCSEIAFVVSVATCLGLFIAMPDGPGRVLVEHWDTLVKGGMAEVFGVPFSIDFFKDFIGKAPAYNLKTISCPVFFLQGAADTVWRRSDAWIGFQVMQKNGLAVKYLEIEGGDHGLDNVPEQSAQEVINWLKEIRVLS
ncbi:MAG: CocE/NonD family hydrolase [Candidatus Hydromicrobium sp.]